MLVADTLIMIFARTIRHKINALLLVLMPYARPRQGLGQKLYNDIHLESIMANQFILPTTIARRARWLDEIVQISGHFGNDSTRIEQELKQEADAEGPISIVDHLRLAGAIPEHYGHDSSEEKLYSKYTDALLAMAFTHLGLNSIVLTERGDAADVEAANSDYALAADAKAFRLSRTAKNQKDFKVEAMHGWKRGKLYAIVVCPIYQLPNRSSQIYQQAIARTVCIFTYSHLTVLARLVEATNQTTAMDTLHSILKCTATLIQGRKRCRIGTKSIGLCSMLTLALRGFGRTKKSPTSNPSRLRKMRR